MCITVKFDASVNAPAVTAARAVPYKSLRQRLHVIKQRFDNLQTRPGTFLMPIVAATNTAARIDALAEGSGAMVAWAAELGSFTAKVSAALTSIEAWNAHCNHCADSLAATSKAWLQSQ